jgi:hypothetical protein
VNQHIALLGDSIFDNAGYTHGLPDVVSHLRRIVPDGTVATRLAEDGSTTADVMDQIANLPPDVGYAAVSMGGNDALLQADALDLPVASTRDALALFGERAAQFEASYRATLDELVRHVPRTVVCTIYNANLSGDEAALTRVGLMIFNDVILRVAFDRRIPVIDLRLVCVDAADYANSLEPSKHRCGKDRQVDRGGPGDGTGHRSDHGDLRRYLVIRPAYLARVRPATCSEWLPLMIHDGGIRLGENRPVA